MKKTLTFVLLSLVLGVTISTPALASWWGRWPGFAPGNCGNPCACRDQDADLDQARRDFRSESRELRQQLHDRKEAYRELMGQDAPNKAAAAQLWSEIFDLQTELQQMATTAGLAGDRRPGRDADPASGAVVASRCGNGPRGNGGRGCGGPLGCW